MGLSVEVGILADLKDMDEEGYAAYLTEFENLNEVLRSNGLDLHAEPDESEEIFACDLLSYAGIHFLRRIAVHRALGKPIPEPGNQETSRNAARTQDDVEYFDRFNAGENMKYQHLVMHSDAEGFYIPVDFERVIVTPSLRLSGGWVGSTQRLQAECMDLAGVLGMPMDMHYESEELTRVADAQIHPRSDSSWRLWPRKATQTEHGDRPDLTWKQYGVETYACLRLIAASEASLRTKAAIVFL